MTVLMVLVSMVRSALATTPSTRSFPANAPLRKRWVQVGLRVESIPAVIPEAEAEEVVQVVVEEVAQEQGRQLVVVRIPMTLPSIKLRSAMLKL
jgi:hypothetical protein